VPLTSVVSVDPRTGSGDLLPMFQAAGIPSRHETLLYGDVQLIGRGPEERPVLIGVEIKAVNDLLQCFVSKRFVGQREDGTPGQLAGMLSAYEIVYLAVEGTMVCVNGELRVLRGGHMERPAAGDRPWRYDTIQAWLHSIRRTGVDVVQTHSRRDTADWIASAYRWWNGKAFEEHESHVGFRKKALAFSLTDTYIVSRKMKVAASLSEGMGMKRARAAAAYFPSVAAMVNATEAEWMQVEGVGKKLAAKLAAEARRVD